jgi:hypothetical protein
MRVMMKKKRRVERKTIIKIFRCFKTFTNIIIPTTE